jgi:hypothetical protein
VANAWREIIHAVIRTSWSRCVLLMECVLVAFGLARLDHQLTFRQLLIAAGALFLITLAAEVSQLCLDTIRDRFGQDAKQLESSRELCAKSRSGACSARVPPNR